jgi:protein Mpv17
MKIFTNLENEEKILYGFIYLQILLNQIVLGPCVIAVVFAWNNLWQGKLSQLPDKYQKDALPTLLFGKKRSFT